MTIKILHTNDAHGTLTDERATEIRPLRAEADLYFDSGDAISTGNLGVPLRQEPVWRVLDGLDCTASVLGNRETHVMETVFKAKIAGAQHPVLAANLRHKDGSRPLPGTLECVVKGVRVGVLGVMVPMVTERMASRAASAYLWDSPIDVAQQLAEKLRPRCDLLIALTHIGYGEDRRLAEQVPAIDVILGGHSHSVLEHPEMVGRTYICQGGSHSRYAGVYEWDGSRLLGGLMDLRASSRD